jgi:large subunit ribosomal protein L31
MKADIHPTYFDKAIATCACGATYVVGSTKEAISVEICSACHPFYTGQMKFVDTAGRVDAFKAKMSKATSHISKTEKRRLKEEKRLQEEASRPESLADLRTKE